MNPFEYKTITTDIINRIMNHTGKKILYIDGHMEGESNLYPAIERIRLEDSFQSSDCDNGLIYLKWDNSRNYTCLKSLLCRDSYSVVIECANSDIIPSYIIEHVQERHFGNKRYLIHCCEIEFPKTGITPPASFKVLAVLHFYNEIDVIKKTVKHLIENEIDVYLVDNWSTDGSYDVALQLHHQYPDKVFLERFPPTQSGNEYYKWYDQLERTERICIENPYSWYIHYDADEIRVPPWKNTTLREAIYYIDSLGYNCVENTVVDFRMTDLGDDIFQKDTYFEFRTKPVWCDQLKTWKRCDDLDLKNSGGHTVSIINPRVFPLNILNRHYPLRTVKQGIQKVFVDRLPRFEYEKKNRGWHTHYTSIKQIDDLIFDKDTLLKWENDTQDKFFFPLFMQCGLSWEPYEELDLSQLKLSSKRIILWGAGYAGRAVYRTLSKNNEVVMWCDKNFDRFPSIYCNVIRNPSEIKDVEFDCFFISVYGDENRKVICEQITSMGFECKEVFYL